MKKVVLNIPEPEDIKLFAKQLFFTCKKLFKQLTRNFQKFVKSSVRDFQSSRGSASEGSQLSICFTSKFILGRLLRFCIAAACMIAICIFGYNIIRSKVENDISVEQVAAAQSITEVTEVEDEEGTTVIIPSEDEPPYNPYWDYVNMKLIDVDFSNLLTENPSTVGWLQVGGTNINYPFVQSSDNDFYLNHSFDRTNNSYGWIFLDYRNSSNLSDKNNVIYAHARSDGSMFGSLKNILSSGWQDERANHIVKVSTPTSNTMWQVFSVYHLPVTSDYIITRFSNDADFAEFIERISSRSAYPFATQVSTSDKILTLSTCYGINDSERLVLHAKLIKSSPKV